VRFLVNAFVHRRVEADASVGMDASSPVYIRMYTGLFFAVADGVYIRMYTKLPGSISGSVHIVRAPMLIVRTICRLIDHLPCIFIKKLLHLSGETSLIISHKAYAYLGITLA